ncbi:hypothetical protein GCM10009836_34840 [Pseudonocardia ailaonensis]|uniref:Ketoreductase domain-containing protein n=1 Tax=Pseudonocardia ailaonensis TaxID=367279 RepID=A0ABN2N4M5_9PSEU
MNAEAGSSVDLPDLDGKVVLVTGGGRGRGRACAEYLARSGATVVVNDLGTSLDGDGRSTGVADEAVEAIRARGGRATADASDVAEAAEAADLVGRILDAEGRIDGILCNAGIVTNKTFAETDDSDWAAMLRVHFDGTLNIVRAAWPHFRDQGRGSIVTTVSTSMLAYESSPVRYPHYLAAKGAVLFLTRALAVEGRPLGIRVNAVAPGGVSTVTRMKALLPGAGQSEESVPAYIPRTVAWLMSEGCSADGEAVLLDDSTVSVLDLSARPLLESPGADVLSLEKAYAAGRSARAEP